MSAEREIANRLMEQNFDRTYFIITTHPTKEDLERAERENKLVVVFLHANTTKVTTVCSGDAIGKVFLEEWGIEPNSRLAVYVCPEDRDLEECREAVLDQLILDTNIAPAGFTQWKTTLSKSSK